MASGRKIGLIYKYDENWIGGTYYIENLIAALDILPAEHKPELTIFVEKRKQFEDLKAKTGYPFLRWNPLKKLSLLKRACNRIGRSLAGREYFFEYEEFLDLVFPATDIRSFKPGQKFLFWIPDFQEHYLTQFFKPEEIAKRKKYQARYVEAAKFMVFSSFAVKEDFNKFYPENNVTQFVLPFAVTHPQISNLSSITEKYGIPENFFICCNQLWIHKNHTVIIKAVHILKKQGYMVFVAFTGKEFDFRNPAYFQELKDLITALGVNDQIKFLGFISREDQLSLMKSSAAVLQPSLFEGWSTVIEDAKALQVKVIASDLAVHREQLSNYKLSCLFEAADGQELADAMAAIDQLTEAVPEYKKNIVAFADNFKKIFETISST